jgi:hypothetical protein
MEKHSQNSIGHAEKVDLARIRAVLSNMEGTCAYLSGQLEQNPPLRVGGMNGMEE